MPSKSTQEERIAAAWPNGIPPGLQRKLERARSEDERAALTEEMAERADRVKTRRDERHTADPDHRFRVDVNGDDLTVSVEGLADIQLTKRQAKQLRKALTEKGI